VKPRITRARSSNSKFRKGIKAQSIFRRRFLSYAILMLTVFSFASLFLHGSSASGTAQTGVGCIQAPVGMVAWYAGTVTLMTFKDLRLTTARSKAV
jgi:hypothetical protein